MDLLLQLSELRDSYKFYQSFCWTVKTGQKHKLLFHPQVFFSHSEKYELRRHRLRQIVLVSEESLEDIYTLRSIFRQQKSHRRGYSTTWQTFIYFFFSLFLLQRLLHEARQLRSPGDFLCCYCIWSETTQGFFFLVQTRLLEASAHHYHQPTRVRAFGLMLDCAYITRKKLCLSNLSDPGALTA